MKKNLEAKIFKKPDLQVILDEYTELVETTNLAGLLPFLQNRTKGHTEALKKHIRKAKSYWLTHVDLSGDHLFKHMLTSLSRWGVRATPAQKDIIVLSAIALFNQKEITPWDEAIGYFDRIYEKNIEEIIAWAKPGWINEFILDKANRNDWFSVGYSNIRYLESKGLIEYHPELFVKMMARFNPWNESGRWTQTDYIEYIANDLTAYTRDVPELFDYETNLQNQYFASTASESNTTVLVWERIFNRLLTENKIERLWFIENCILIQTKEWNTSLRSFFRKRLADAQPNSQELLQFQNILFHCLHAPVNAVVHFAIDLIKNIYQEKDFHFHDFLEWVEPVMMRIDCKGGIKTLLGIFDKILKTNPGFKEKISHLTADTFVIADLTLQERAYKTFEKAGDPDDHVLKEKVEMYLPQMQGNIAVLMSRFLKTEQEEVTETAEEYDLILQKSRYLLDEQRVLPFENWNEILFQFGKFISSWQVIEGERLLDAFITQQHMFPADAQEQLRVYGNQLQKTYFLWNDKNVTAGLLVHMIEGRREVYNPAPVAYRNSNVLNLAKEILLEVQRKITAKSPFSLLSFPTHAPHWVDPVVLVERLLVYQKTGWKIDWLDFTIAIARMPRENTVAALRLCDQLEKELARLMKFALGASDKIEVGEEPFFKKIFSGTKSESTLIRAAWAVAARTFYPNSPFPEFDNTSLKDLPNVSYPLVPDAHVATRRSEVTNHWTKKTEHYVFRELLLDLPAKQSMPVNLLYSRDVYERKSDQYILEFLAHGDVLYWHGLMPQNDQALATMILKYSCKSAETGSDDLNAFLYLSAQPEFVFTETSMLVFACCMFSKNLNTRSYASEILNFLIASRKIDISALGEKAGYLISENYGPLQRFIDVITPIRDISPLHSSAIIKLMNSLILNFRGKDTLPMNFKKLLELYLDILMKAKAKPGENVLGHISVWKDYPAIRSVLKQIQSI